MKANFLSVAVTLACTTLIVSCSEDNSVAPVSITTTTYSGKITDPVMTAALGAAYTGTTYVYSICSNDSFAVTADVLYGAALVETGTYSVSGSTYSFVPKVNKISNPTTHAMEVSSTNRPNYTGTASGNDLTIPAFTDVGNVRVIGTLTLTKQ